MTAAKPQDLPGIDQLRVLPALGSHAVSSAAVDHNGHLGVIQFFELAMYALGEAYDAWGVGSAYRVERNLAFFIVEQHQAYRRELLPGTRTYTTVRLLDLGSRALHAVVLMADEDAGDLVFSSEIVAIHASLATRRAVALPEDARQRLEAELASHRRLSWVPPHSQALGLRRS